MKRWLLTAILAVFFVFLLMSVYVRQAMLFLVGIGLGATLAAARFGFTTGWRKLVIQRDPSGAAGQLLLLALAALLAMPLLGQFPELQAALGPPSISLIVGAFVFGIAMQVADGCGSGTLYKAGLGFPLNMGLLPFFALGSFLGASHLQGWLSLGQIEPIGFVQSWGVTIALLLTAGLLLGLATLMRLWVGSGKTWFSKRWVWGAVLLSVFATLNLVLAGQPWGVVLAVNFNEREALSTFQRLKLRFPKLIANRQPMITRKRNLSRGTRRMVFVMLGENHENEDHHRLQAWIVAALIGEGRRPAPSL